MNYNGAYKYVTNRLEKGLAADLLYHGLHHTLDVVATAELIAENEGLSTQEISLAKTAALYHDMGFLFEYEDNEMQAMDLVKQTLPEFDYSNTEIEIIVGMIAATIIHVKPETHLEKIMVDADFDYFGRNDFEQIAATLYTELKAYGNEYSIKQWDEVQVQFLKKHRYYTNFSLKNRQNKKQKNLSNLIERLSEYD
ncbi:MAG: HD domain-containing protein [Flavobacteriales bacterium]|nr:HD domain-containing protein [Flavobacteriales bacterium]